MALVLTADACNSPRAEGSAQDVITGELRERRRARRLCGGFDLFSLGGRELHMQRCRPAISGIGLLVAGHDGHPPQKGPEKFQWNLLSGYQS